MTFDVELELMTRPQGRSAVALVAERLRIRLADARSMEVHDFRMRRDERLHPVVTLAPSGFEDWASETETVWNRTEWVERHGPAPVLFELRAHLPERMQEDEARRAGRELAMFVAHELDVPVSFVYLDGTSIWPIRGEEGRHLRLCFPTRTLANREGANAILDRSGNPSGFTTRLPMATNPHLGQRFAGDVTREYNRILGALPPSSTKATPTRNPFEFDLGVDDDDLTPPVAAIPTNPATHPLVARLRREAPRGMTLPDLRDFESAMDTATELEDALKSVTQLEHDSTDFGERHTRTRSHILDHAFLLDQARLRRSEAKGELKALQASKGGLFVFLKGRMQVASLARATKAEQYKRADGHVQALKRAMESLQKESLTLAGAKVTTGHALVRARDELKDGVRRLQGIDPAVLMHLLGIVSGPQRTYLKIAMARAMPPAIEPDSSQSQGKSGPPSQPSRGGPGPKR